MVAVGDELLAGAGDPRALGWYGRVLARTPHDVVPISSYVLAAPGEGSEALNDRWFGEASLRFAAGADNRLVIAPSTRDVDLAITTARSRLHMANMVDTAAQSNVKVLVVGPPPTLDRIATGASPISRPPSRTSSLGATTSTSTPSIRCSTTSSGARTSRRTTAAPARPATASSPGSCCTAAGTPGWICPSRSDPRDRRRLVPSACADVEQWADVRGRLRAVPRRPPPSDPRPLDRGGTHEQAWTQAQGPPQEQGEPRQAPQLLSPFPGRTGTAVSEGPDQGGSRSSSSSGRGLRHARGDSSPATVLTGCSGGRTPTPPGLRPRCGRRPR